MPTTEGLYIGLMSGTSVDGIDAALVDIAADHCTLIEAIGRAWPRGLEQELKTLATATTSEIDLLGSIDRRVALEFAHAVSALLKKSGIDRSRIRAIGCHGQTIRHRPGGSPSFSWQLGDPSTLAERSGITTVAQFRQRDIAAGGQGAPLVPAFHRALFASRSKPLAILNIGGIANLTLLDENNGCRGFDSGPGNTLIDALMRTRCNQPFDRDGLIAARGSPQPELLDLLLRDPYFSQSPPKSTGPEYFNLSWLDKKLERARHATIRLEDLTATLTALSVRSIADAIARFAPRTREVLVCGGGVHNPRLLEGLSIAMPGRVVASTAQAGIDPDWMEAMAFGWLASRTLSGLYGNVPEVTGAEGPRVLGGIYPA